MAGTSQRHKTVRKEKNAVVDYMDLSWLTLGS